MRRLVVALLVLFSVFVAAPAVAADDPVLRFEGTVNVTDVSEQTQYGTFLALGTIDCSSGDCLLTISTSDQGDTILLANAVPITPAGGSFAQDAVGDPCDDTGWLDASTINVGFDDTAIVFSRDSLGSGEKDCPDGSTVAWDAAHLEGTLQLTSGDSCVFFGGCPTAEPAAPGTVRYDGTGTVTYPAFPDLVREYSVFATFDCSSTPCLLTMGLFGGESNAILTGPDPLPFTGPTESYSLAAYGDPCQRSAWIGEGTLDVTRTDDGFTVTRTSAASPACPDGAQQEYPAFILTSTLSRTTGDDCLLDGSCAAAPVIVTHATAAKDPSVLSALAAPAAAVEPANLLWAAAVAVVLVLLVAFPTHLLNSAIETGTARLGALRRRRPRARIGWPYAAAGVLAASVISSFVNPDVGFNAASVRVFLSILVSFVLDAVVGWFLLIWLVRRVNPTAKPSFTFAPLTLLVVIAAVVFTRVTGFQPGIVFGLVAGVTFGAILATSGKAKQTLVSLGYSFGLAIIAWIGYGLLEGAEGVALVFLRETLSSVAIGGIAALPIALIPLRGLSGHDVFRWKRWVWVVAYAVGLVGFFLVLMPRPFSWQTVPLSIGTWIAIYLVYAVVAVGLWLWITKPWKSGAKATD